MIVIKDLGIVLNRYKYELYLKTELIGAEFEVFERSE